MAKETNITQKKIMMGIAAVVVVLGALYLFSSGNQEQLTTAQVSVDAKDEFNKGRALSKEKKYKEALEMYIKSADKGYFPAMNHAGVYLCNGYGDIEPNVTKGISYLTKAADSGLSYAQVNLGRAYMTPQYGLKRDTEKGLKYMNQAAAQNNSDAMFYLGYYYEVGLGVEKNKDKALAWYKKAVEHGNKAAQKRADNLKK